MLKQNAFRFKNDSKGRLKMVIHRDDETWTFRFGGVATAVSGEDMIKFCEWLHGQWKYK